MLIHLVGSVVVSLVLGPLVAAQHVHPEPTPQPAFSATSALTAEAVQQLLAGAGMGLAQPAESHWYPGPKHVLELERELRLSEAQKEQVEVLRQRMLARARSIGQEIVNAERALDAAFKASTISESELEERLRRIAPFHGALRATHLKAHLLTKPILSPDQLRRYYEARSRR